MRVKIRNQAGDTIVEVLVCILIISVVLAGAFTVTNKSLLSVRASQERSQAIKLAEAQLERLRTAEAAVALAVPFCVHPDGTVTSVGGATSKECYFGLDGAVMTVASVQGVPGTAGTPVENLYSSDREPQYQVRVQLVSGVYEVKVKWVAIRGDLGQTSMSYSVVPRT
jgi:Tfp pilus assembly protein PilV